MTNMKLLARDDLTSTEVISPCYITIPEREVTVQEHYVPCITIPEREVMVQRQYIPDRVRLGRI